MIKWLQPTIVTYTCFRPFSNGVIIAKRVKWGWIHDHNVGVISPWPFILGVNFHTAVTKNKNPLQSVPRILLKKKCSKVVKFWWKKGHKSPYLDNEFPEGRWEPNKKFYFAGWPQGKSDSWHLLAEDDRQSISLTKLKRKKPWPSLASGLKHFCNVITWRHNMVFEHMLYL